MKIRRLTIKNLRGLSEVKFEFDKATNVIVGPNAIGKTTVLESVRLAKALLMPRYFQEAHQVLVSLGSLSPHFQMGLNQIDYAALARDPESPVEVILAIELSQREIELLKGSIEEIALDQLRASMGRSDEQGQFALTQFLSSEDGRKKLLSMTQGVEEKLHKLVTPCQLPIHLTMDGRRGQVMGKDSFSQTMIQAIERKCRPDQALFSFFPADRAFPTGEVNIQIGSAEANNQIQSHVGQASSKYNRLKQTVVNSLLFSGVDPNKIQQDFELVFQHLLPGKRLARLSVTPVGTLKVEIEEMASGKVFDIDSMSSGEKGLVLTFLLIRRGMERGGIVLIDEPELHLNQSVCRKIIPFLNDKILPDNDLQVIICTHSAEILGAAFERPDCTVHHLRSHKDATKIYERDHREVFEVLRRLGTTAADSLFSRGNLFVEGEHDISVLEEVFYEVLNGYKVTSLGGRSEVEKEIKALQEAEKRGDLDKIHCFIFDMDTNPVPTQSSKFVRVMQWDRYCLENYLLDRKAIYDVLQELAVKDLGSRGEFEKSIVDIATGQLKNWVIKEVYSGLEPESPGLRATEIASKDYKEAARILSDRLLRIRKALMDFNQISWLAEFEEKCIACEKKKTDDWHDNWTKLASGKQVFDDLYRRYTIPLPKVELKKRVGRKMLAARTEDWTLVRAKLNEAISA